MDVCIGASCGSLVPMLSINQENMLSLFGLNSVSSLDDVICNYISRSCILSEKLDKRPAEDHCICPTAFTDNKVNSNILCQ